MKRGFDVSDFHTLSLARQSCRAFTGQPVAHELLEQLLDAAHLAPSACNSQPWSFVAVETPELVRQVAQCGQQMGMNPFLDKAGAFIVVLEEHAVLMPKLRVLIDSQYFAKADIGGAIAYLCLQATDVGLGSCQIGIFDREALCRLLGIPQDKAVFGLIAVGHPSETQVRDKKRKPLGDIIRFA